jgi:hypothetical protein
MGRQSTWFPQLQAGLKPSLLGQLGKRAAHTISYRAKEGYEES